MAEFITEKISHPTHYNIKGKRECIVAIREDYGDFVAAVFCLTNAYKYLYRAGNKQGESVDDDIAKARWYFDYHKKLSYVFNNDVLKLYKYVEKELKKYDKG